MTGSDETILGALFAFAGRSTRAIVDLDAVATNVRTIRSSLPADQAFCAVVKANGYGHGSVMIARTAIGAGATMCAVATVGEAADLRAHGIAAPILLLGPIDSTEVARAVQIGCEITVAGSELLTAVMLEGERLGQRVPVHLKIDTGMNRFGCAPHDAVGLAVLANGPGTRLAGISSHFASADESDSPTTPLQINLMAEVLDRITQQTGLMPPLHLSNSAGALRQLESNGAFVRVGIAMYGLRPGPEVDLLPGMRPALSLVSRLGRVHDAPPDAGVSYGQTYRTTGRERLGLVPLGYADGYHRVLSNRAWMSLGGQKCPVRGRVCMDQTVIGNLPAGTQFGATVGVMGPIGGGPSLDQIAADAGTINYEIATAVNARVSRYYWRDGQFVAVLEEGKLTEFEV